MTRTPISSGTCLACAGSSIGTLTWCGCFHRYIYIVCATGKTAPEMLRILESRMENGTEEELAVAAAEQSKITKLRLKKLVQE